MNNTLYKDNDVVLVDQAETKIVYGNFTKNLPKYTTLQEDMVNLMSTENATSEDTMAKINMISYVASHHHQEITLVSTGRNAGHWSTHYYVGGKRKAVSRASKEELIKFLYDFYKKGEERKSKDQFSNIYKEMLDYKKKMELVSEKTLLDYQNYYDRFMEPISDRSINALTEDDLRQWIVRDVLPQHPKDTVLQRLFLYVRKAFKYAIKKRYTSVNPMEYIDYSEYSKHCDHHHRTGEESCFTPDEIEKIKADMWNDADNPRALVALFNIETGCRADEPVALHKADIHEGYIDIHRQQIRLENGAPERFYEVDYTKDTRCKVNPSRKFPITPAIQRIIDTAMELPGESEYLFHDDTGKMISKESYEQFLRRRCKKLGLTTTNNHAFRKALNNNVFIPLGLSANERAALLGHTVRTNEQNYSLRQSYYLNEIGEKLSQNT